MTEAERKQLAELLARGETASHSDLLYARYSLPPKDELQARLAPLEHRALVREAVAENPLRAPAYLAMIPGYALAKELGIVDEGERTTAPSLDQMAEAYRGLQDGLAAALARRDGS